MLAGYSVVFVLVLLLVGTTPIGTGSGVHQFDLVHPLFTHVHLVNGRLLTHEQLGQAVSVAAPAPGRATNTPGPAIADGSVTDPPDSGVGWSPTLQLEVASLLPGPLWAWMTLDAGLPDGRAEAPPDPPPTRAG